MLSVLLLTWNNLDLTRRCLASLREGTIGEHEVIVVDNGSGDGTPAFATEQADVAIIHETNLGFAAGMNSGLRAASGDYVAFVNNDTVFPVGWNTHLLEHFDDPDVGIVTPAVTSAGNPVTVRGEPGTDVIRLLPFGEFPSGVIYVMRREVALGLGGWNEDYPIASSEDLDLCFTVWANGLDVVLDTRVLVDHVGQASVRNLPDRARLYADNLGRFLTRWSAEEIRVPTLPNVKPDELDANLARARTAVRWIERVLDARREAAAAQRELDQCRSHSTAASPGPLSRWLRRS